MLEDNPRARAFYERGGWSPDGERKSEERWGVRAAEVRYRKAAATCRTDWCLTPVPVTHDSGSLANQSRRLEQLAVALVA